MPFPEPDLPFLATLIDARTWRRSVRDDRDATRLAAACALAWLAGAQVKEMARLRLGDWRPGGADVVRITRGDPDTPLERAAPTARLIPILAPLKRAMKPCLDDLKGAPPEAFVFDRLPPWDGDPRGWLEVWVPKVMKDSLGPRATSLRELAALFRTYAHWPDPEPEPGVAEWLAGRIDLKLIGRLGGGGPPDPAALRRRLLEVHPGARVRDVDEAARS